MKTLAFILGIILVFGNLGAIEISGTQSGTWSATNNPHNLVGDVTIPNGQTLSIEPGVEIYARGNYRITAEGIILAVGTEADSIRFLGGQDDPNALWGGIRLEHTSQASQFSRCYIEKATYGINSINSPAAILRCRFNLNQKGMQLYGIGGPALVEVYYNIVENSVQNGILIAQNSLARIIDNEIRYNGTGTQYYAAIQLSNQSGGGQNSPEICGNHIHHNYKQGITAWDVAAANAIQPYIHDNLIEYNLTGIYLLNASGFVENNIIRYNFISGNPDSGAGVMVAGATSAPYFERNEIYNNFTGFYIGNNAQPVLGDLSIYHAWAQGQNSIFSNYDESGLLHSVYCYSYTNSSIVIKAENNYWGTDDPAQINLGIYDQLDYPSLPLVDYDPWLGDGPALTYLSGTLDYNGDEALANHRIEILGSVSETVKYTAQVALGTQFSLEFEIDEPFYVLAMADVVGQDRILYAAPGGFYYPTLFEPEEQNSAGNLFFHDYQTPHHYYITGSPEQDADHLIYPVYHKFWHYHWDYTNWFYDDGDYRFLKRHTRYHPDKNLEFELSDGMMWDKFQNRQPGESWQRWEVMDDLGMLRNSIIYYFELDDGMVENRWATKLLTQIDLGTGKVISQMEYVMYEEAYLYNFDSDANLDNWMLVSGGFFNLPLNEDSITRFVTWTPCYSPWQVLYDPIQYAENGVLELHWQPPAKDYIHTWTHYRIYDNDQILAIVDYEQPCYMGAISNNQSHLIKITAYDGNLESDPSGILYLPSTASEDLVSSPMMVKTYPNPFSSKLFIELETGKSIAGEVSIYNLRGQKIRSQSFDTKDGKGHLTWDGRDSQGNTCSKGIYFIRVNSPGRPAITKRIVKM